jgi:hypothetical protein
MCAEKVPGRHLQKDKSLKEVCRKSPWTTPAVKQVPEGCVQKKSLDDTCSKAGP